MSVSCPEWREGARVRDVDLNMTQLEDEKLFFHALKGLNLNNPG
jgi:hypothetical protein